MKNLFLFIATVTILFTVQSCNLYKKMPQYLADHNFQKSMTIDHTTGANNFTASIDSLYDYSKVAEVCDTLDITFKISRGSVSVKGDCSNVGDDVILILQKAISKIKFW